MATLFVGSLCKPQWPRTRLPSTGCHAIQHLLCAGWSLANISRNIMTTHTLCAHSHRIAHVLLPLTSLPFFFFPSGLTDQPSSFVVAPNTDPFGIQTSPARAHWWTDTLLQVLPTGRGSTRLSGLPCWGFSETSSLFLANINTLNQNWGLSSSGSSSQENAWCELKESHLHNGGVPGRSGEEACAASPFVQLTRAPWTFAQS